MYKIGAQLYTVRELLKTPEQMGETLLRMKEIGYDSVQLYNLGSLKAMESCCETCKQLGLEIVGVLLNLDWCEKNTDELFSLCRKYEISDIGVSSEVYTHQEALAYIPRMNAFAKIANEQGFSFSYHNHGFEFIKTAGEKTTMDLFIEGFDRHTVSFMPDTYWIHDGGCCVQHFIKIVGQQIKILHLKDLKRIDRGHTFAEVGSGNLYMEGIIETAIRCGVMNFVVEQDICEGDPLHSLQQSYDYIKNALEGK